MAKINENVADGDHSRHAAELTELPRLQRGYQESQSDDESDDDHETSS
jgi:hypothetical protein